MKYSLTTQAEEDLIEIYLYGVKRFGVFQAEKYFNSFENEFERIGNNPEMFPFAYHIRKDYQYCVHVAHTIFFKAESNQSRIIRIIGRQDFENEID